MKWQFISSKLHKTKLPSEERRIGVEEEGEEEVNRRRGGEVEWRRAEEEEGRS